MVSSALAMHCGFMGQNPREIGQSITENIARLIMVCILVGMMYRFELAFLLLFLEWEQFGERTRDKGTG